MNLKLSALIVCSTLFSLSACLPQDQGTDELEEIKTKLHAYAAGQSLEVVPVRRLNPRRAFKDLNLPQKRGEADLPPIGLYVCENALFKDRCEHLTSKRGFCCTYIFFFMHFPATLSHTHVQPLQATPGHGFII